jgi:hypothetical protein
VIRNAWTGEISKFRVRVSSSKDEVILSPDEILEMEDEKIKLSVSSDELKDNT